MGESGIKLTMESSSNFGSTILTNDVESLVLPWLISLLPGKFLEFDITQMKRDSGPMIDRIELYGLSEKLVLPSLMDYTATSILSGYERHQGLPSLEAISTMYQCTTDRAPMRPYMAKQLHRIMSTEEDSVDSPYSTQNVSQTMLASEDLTQDLMQLMRGLQTAPSNPTYLPKCTFHIHSKEHDCNFKTLIPE